MSKTFQSTLIFALTFTVICNACANTDERLRGPLPQKQRDIIHQLAENHTKIKRKIKFNQKGYRASTTCEDKKIAKMLQEHLRYMKKRVDAGFPVRRWDPAFWELSQHSEDIEVKVENLENGVAVLVIGKTKNAVKVAQNHGKIISAFIKNGASEVAAEHETALE